MKALSKLSAIITSAVLLLPAISLAQWVQTNGPYGGTVRTFLSCNYGGDTSIFAGTDGGGIYRSTDNGSTWTAVNSGLTASFITSMVVNGADIYVSGRCPGGIFSSSDNGSWWVRVNSPCAVNCLAVRDSDLFAEYDGGICKSSDHGETWIRIDSSLGISGINCILTSGRSIYLGTAHDGVYGTMDEGTTWTALNAGFTTDTGSAFGHYTIRALASFGPYLLAGVWGGGVFRSTNGGATWNIANVGLSNHAVESFVAIDTNLFVGTVGGVFLSTDYGASWTPRNSGLADSQVFALGVSGTTLFEGSGAGASRSTDLGATWTTVNTGLASTMSISVAVSGTNLYASSGSWGYGYGVCHSTDNGTSWTLNNMGLADPWANCMMTSGTNLYAGTNQGVYLSQDSGTTWENLNSTFCVDGMGLSGAKILAGVRFDGAYLSTNRGGQWSPVFSGLAQYTTVECFAFSGKNVFAGTQSGTSMNGSVILSTDNGISWAHADSGLPNYGILALSLLDSNLFAATSGIYTSTNNGTNWTEVVPGTWVFTCFAVFGHDIFAGSSYGGVYLSTDYGASWTAINSGFLNLEVWSLALSDSFLFAGTYCSGVWKWPLAQLANQSAIHLSAIHDISQIPAKAIPVSYYNRTSGQANAPVRNTASVESHGNVLLKWTRDHHAHFARYRIYADTIHYPHKQIDSTSWGVTDTIRLVEGLTYGKKYFFRVMAVDDSSNAENYSNQATAVADLYIAKPFKLTAIPGDGQVTLKWGADSHSDFLFYRVYGDTIPHPTVLIDSISGNATDTMRIIQGLRNGTAYFFRVAATDKFNFECDSSSDVPASPNIFVCPMNSGWNMVSVPSMVEDYRRSALYPFAASNAFSYQNTYVLRDTLSNGIGYWVRFSSDLYASMGGTPCVEESVSVQEGWNLIGSISTPVAVTEILSIPAGIQTSQFFGYRGVYFSTDSIEPGGGYWVKTNQNGVLILSMPELAKLNGSNRIKILPTSEMPPRPPAEGDTEGDYLPREYHLAQSYPNPFNPTTTIRYDLPTQSRVSLTIYNLLGQVVATLANGTFSAGYQSAVWNASSLASGIYFCRLEATSVGNPSKTFTQVKKMVLLK